MAPPPIDLPPGVASVQLRSAHYGSFIFNKMIGQVRGKPADGDMVAVIDPKGLFFGWGFYNSRSKIALRMFSRSRPVATDADVAARVIEAVRMRRDLLRLEESSDAYRLVHAEGDGLSGLIADKFGRYVVIELFSLAMARRLELIEDAFVEAGLDVEQFIVRVDKAVAQAESIQPPRHPKLREEHTVVTENGVKFKVQLGKGHKTGFFCDQRDNRRLLAELTPGKRVLDVCCYTGGFSVYAAARGQAAEVTAVDLDEMALPIAAENAALNDVAVDFQHADAFDFLRAAQAEGRRWDVVIVDPSKFVPRRTLLEHGLHKYTDLNRLAAGVVSPGGVLLTCSCSGLVDQATFLQTVGRAVRFGGRELQVFRFSGAGADHPALAESPEGFYLKAIWGRVL